MKVKFLQNYGHFEKDEVFEIDDRGEIHKNKHLGFPFWFSFDKNDIKVLFEQKIIEEYVQEN